MKTTQIKKIAMLAVVLVASTLLTACNKKDDGGGNATPPYYFPGCTNCGSMNSLLGGPYYSANYAMTMTMTLDIVATQQAAPAPTTTCPTTYPYNNSYPNYYCGTPTAMTGIPYGGYPVYGNPVTNYMGPAALKGNLRVTTQDYSTCYAWPGDYTINTTQAGQMYAGNLSGIVMEAVGPNGGRMIFQLITSQVYKSNPSMYNSTIDRIGLTMQVVSVNGQPCGTISTY